MDDSRVKKKLLMFVYSDLSKDARVQRSIEALKDEFDITIISFGESYLEGAVNNRQVSRSMKTGGRSYGKYLTQICRVTRKSKFHIVYAHDFHSALPAILLRRIYGLKTIYDAHELFLPVKGDEKGLYFRFFHFWEKKIIKKAELLICANEERAKVMVKIYSLLRAPIVIKNISKLSLVECNISTVALSKFLKSEKKTIVYAGVLIADRNLEFLIREASQVAESYQVLIVGSGGTKDYLEQYASKYPQLEVFFSGSIPHRDLGNVLKLCDVGFISYPENSLNNRYCASNKVYEYASINLPILCNDNPTLVKEVVLNGIGEVMDEGHQFEDVLKSLEKNAQEVRLSIDRFNDKNRWSKYRSRLIRAIKNL